MISYQNRSENIKFILSQNNPERYPLEDPADQSYFANANELELAVNGCYKGINFSPATECQPNCCSMIVPILAKTETRAPYSKSGKEATTVT